MYEHRCRCPEVFIETGKAFVCDACKTWKLQEHKCLTCNKKTLSESEICSGCRPFSVQEEQSPLREVYWCPVCRAPMKKVEGIATCGVSCGRLYEWRYTRETTPGKMTRKRMPKE